MVIGSVGASALVICCTFPDYAVVTDVPGDSTVDDADASASETFDETPLDSPRPATCDDGGVRVGEAVPCPCGDAGTLDAATLDTGDDTDAIETTSDATPMPTGLRACTQSGSFGACVGCSATSCEGTTLPQFTACIPGGVVSLGVKNVSVCAPSGCALEMPEHPVALSRFYLDDREVTVSRFREWWNAGHVSPKAGELLFTAGDGSTVAWNAAWPINEPKKSDGSNDATWLGATDSTNDASPINYVDWSTALAFCAAYGRRLPTEAEWEAAASGRDGRIFPRESAGSKGDPPSGSMLPCSRAISAAGGSSCGPPKKAAPDGFSVDGAYDLAGSVAEWTLDVAPPGGASCTGSCYPNGPLVDYVAWSDSATMHAVRGGHYADTEPKNLRAQARAFYDATTSSSKIGFRCAKR